MSSIFRKRAGRVSALVTAVGMVAFLVQLAIPASAAVAPPTDVGSIFPVSGGTFSNDYTGGGSTYMNLVADRGGPADLKAISTAEGEATQMTWYDCAPGDGPGVDTQGPFTLAASCVSDGVDTTATVASLSSDTLLGASDVEDAWSIAFDVPTRLNGQERDLVAVGCNGAALANNTNCTADTVDTWFDDSTTSTPNSTSSGTITSIFPSSSDTAAAVNGVAVSSQDGFDATGTTSPDLTEVAFALDDGTATTAANPQGSFDVDVYDYDVVDTPDTTTATAKTWSTVDGTFEGDGSVGSAFTADTGMAFTFGGTDNGSFNVDPGLTGFSSCATVGGNSCAMDRVYLVSELGSTFADHTFLRLAADVTADPTCETGATTFTAPAGSTVDLTGCVINAFGTGVADDNVIWRVNDLSIGNFVGQPDAVTDASGYANATVSGPTNAVGRNLVVTFCADETNNGICDSDAVTSQFQITWTGTVGPTRHHRSVTLRLRDSLKARGKVRVTDGFAACASHVPVKVQKRVSGHWKTLKSIKTSSSGAYRTRLPNEHGRYRSLAPRVTKGGDICGKAKSPTRTH